MGRTELCAWLRANSSGIYRPAADAADEIEHLVSASDGHFRQAMLNGEAATKARAEADALRKNAESERLLVGDYFTHDRTGVRFVCRSVTRHDYAGTTPSVRVEIEPAP